MSSADLDMELHAVCVAATYVGYEDKVREGSVTSFFHGATAFAKAYYPCMRPVTNIAAYGFNNEKQAQRDLTHVCAFADVGASRAIIALRGSLTALDWIHNVAMLSSKIIPQVIAENLFRNASHTMSRDLRICHSLVKSLRGSGFACSIAGHSAGGFKAYNFAAMLDVHAHVFNAPLVQLPTMKNRYVRQVLRQLGIKYTYDIERCTFYVGKHKNVVDVIGRLNLESTSAAHMRVVEAADDPSRGRIELAHSITAFIREASAAREEYNASRVAFPDAVSAAAGTRRRSGRAPAK